MSEDFLFINGRRDAPFLVITEPPEEDAYDSGLALTPSERRFFKSIVESYGMDFADFAFLPCCAPMGEDVVGDKDQTAHLNADQAEFWRKLRSCTPRMILPMGRHALRQITGRAAQIGKARGHLNQIENIHVPVLPLSGIRQCLWFPENIPVFISDLNLAAILAENDFDPESIGTANLGNTDYRYVDDLSEIMDPMPKFIAVDTETTGLKWTDPSVRVLTVQVTPRPGVSLVCPVDPRAHMAVWPDMDARTRGRRLIRLKQQLKTLLESERVGKILSNGKFDFHQCRESLGIKIKGWRFETQQLAFLVDENMQNKGLDEGTRRWVPQLAAYADDFNATVDKGNMLGLLREDPDKFLRYAGGDTDASYRLGSTLAKLGYEDEQQWNLYKFIQLPALQAFADRIEPHGLLVDREKLAQLQVQIEAETAETHNRVLSQLSPTLRRKHLKDGLRLSRPALVSDALFSKDGLNIEPIVFTKGTKHKSPEERVASTSAKQHLIYFAHEPLVEGIMRWGKLEKMRTTYVGRAHDEEKGGPTGFWKHLVRRGDNYWIHPSFFLHRTVTGRSSSSEPNAQNFPKRGDLAKSFRSVFIAPPGWKLIEADLSQAEIRIAASEAGEREMIRLYNEGVDIHANTGSAITGNDIARVLANKKSQDLLLDVANEWPGSGDFLRKMTGEARRTATVADYIAQIRYQAKAVNFGFLYGMQWRGFKTYAKLDYGIDYSDEDAQGIRSNFFQTYPDLIPWHQRVERFVYEHGYVRSLHGAIRHLPSIYSVKRSIQAEAVRQAINSPVQRFASDLGIMALWRLCRDAPADLVRPVAFIHDAVLAYVREDYAEEGAGAIRWYMENPPLEDWFGMSLPLPIVADASIGNRLSEVEEVKVSSRAPDWWNADADREPAYIFQTN